MTGRKITRDMEYEDALSLLEEKLYNGVRVTPDWKSMHILTDLRDEDRGTTATSSRSSQGDVIADLQARNPGLPPWAFESKLGDKKNWTGMRVEWARNTEYDPDDWDDRGRLVNKPDTN